MSEADTIREALAAQLHDVYQAEAKRQGDVRHHDDYADLSEPIKDFNRALADFILERDAALERRAEQAERGRVAAELASGRAARDVMFDAIRRANSDEHEAIPDSCVECGVIIGGEHECATASPYIERLTARAEQAEAERDAARSSADAVHKAASDNAQRANVAEAALRRIAWEAKGFNDKASRGLGSPMDKQAEVMATIAERALAVTSPGEPQCEHESQFIDGHWRCLRCGEHPTACCATTPGEPRMTCPTCGSTYRLRFEGRCAARYATPGMEPDFWHRAAGTMAQPAATTPGEPRTEEAIHEYENAEVPDA